MKKVYIISGIIFSILLFATLAAAAPIGKISRILGNVDITPAGASQARVVSAGDAVNTGDIIRTKSKSKAEITFNEGNTLRLAENTRVKISDYMSGRDKNNSLLKLMRGTVENTVKTVGGIAGGRYEVHTETAASGVRGTQFFVSFYNGVTRVVIQEGAVYGYNLKMPDNVQTMNPGQAMMVAGAAQAPVKTPVSPSELKALQQATDPGSSTFAPLGQTGQEPPTAEDLLKGKDSPGLKQRNTLETFTPPPGETKTYIPPPRAPADPHPYP